MQVVSLWNAWLEGVEMKSEVSAGQSTVLGSKPPGVQFTEKGMVIAFQYRGQFFTASVKRTIKKLLS